MTTSEALAMSLAAGFTSIWLVLAAILVGWLARSWAQALLGAAAVAAVAFLIPVAGGLPEGAEIVWWSAVTGLVPAGVWALAAFLLATWLRRRTERGPDGAAVRTARAAVGALVGAVVAGVAVAAAGSAYVELAEVSSFEGASGYLVVFGFAAPAMLIGLLAGAVIGWRRRPRPPPSAA